MRVCVCGNTGLSSHVPVKKIKQVRFVFRIRFGKCPVGELHFRGVRGVESTPGLVLVSQCCEFQAAATAANPFWGCQLGATAVNGFCCQRVLANLFAPRFSHWLYAFIW